MRVCRVAEMRDLDRRASDEFGIPELVLMENAGAAAFDALCRELGIAGGPVVLVCGGGNNGGDGLVVARRLHAAGWAVRVFLLADPERYAGAARTNYEIVARLAVPLERVTDPAQLVAALAGATAVVDAVLGTGVDRPVGGLYGAAIEAINAAGRPVLAVDVPSGVSGDTGAVLGRAVRASATVTFGLPKVGSLLPPGADLGGRLFVSHISFPPALYDRPGLPIALLDAADVRHHLAGVAELPLAPERPDACRVLAGGAAAEHVAVPPGEAGPTCWVYELEGRPLDAHGPGGQAGSVPSAVDGALALACQRQAVVVGLGAVAIVAGPDGQVRIGRWPATPAGGTGGGAPLVAGLISALVGRGLPAGAAAAAAVLLGDVAAVLAGPGIAAGDVRSIAGLVPEALRLVRDGLPARLAVRYQPPVVL